MDSLHRSLPIHTAIIKSIMEALNQMLQLYWCNMYKINRKSFWTISKIVIVKKLCQPKSITKYSTSQTSMVFTEYTCTQPLSPGLHLDQDAFLAPKISETSGVSFDNNHQRLWQVFRALKIQGAAAPGSWAYRVQFILERWNGNACGQRRGCGLAHSHFHYVLSGATRRGVGLRVADAPPALPRRVAERFNSVMVGAALI